MIVLRLVTIAMLLGACSELVNQDDPRLADDFEEPGSCTGVAVSCEDRAQNQCSGGCEIKQVCHSVDLERCTAHRDANACDSDSACSWSVEHCRADVGVACGAYHSAVACADAPFNGCTWGNACTGSSTTFCFEAETSTACGAIPGCTWEPG